MIAKALFWAEEEYNNLIVVSHKQEAIKCKYLSEKLNVLSWDN